MTGPQLRVTFTTEGDDVTRAVRELSREIRGLGQEQRRARTPADQLTRSLRRVALEAVAVVGAARLFGRLTDALVGATRAGLRFNETLETAQLGIASLIASQARLADATGRQLEGVEALDRALGLAEDQMLALRIAGIRTAATTEQLVEAFQVALAPGIRAGLDLEEIRAVTVRITQAAGALGVPFRELAQETRAILSATIDRNARVAQALGLTNAEVNLAKEQGRLAQLLLDRTESFADAGERALDTFAGVRSTIADAVQLLAGEATEPLFEGLTDSGREALGRVFDLETGELRASIQGIVSTSRRVFDEMARLLADAIEGGVDAAERLNDFLVENREELEAAVDEAGDLARGIGRVSEEMGELVGAVVEWSVESGAVVDSLDTLADITEVIADNFQAIAVVLGGLGLRAAVPFLAAHPVVATVVALGTAVAALDQLIQTQAEAVREGRRLANMKAEEAEALNEAAVQAVALSREYERLSGLLASGSLSAEESENAERRLREIRDELIQLSPAYGRALRSAANDHRSVAAAIEEETEARRRGLIIQIQAARQAAERAREARAEAEAELAEARESPVGRGQAIRLEIMGGGIDRFEPQVDAIEELDAAAEEAEARLDALVDAFQRFEIARVGAPTQILPGTEDGPDPADLLKAIRTQAEAALAAMKDALGLQEAELRASLEDNLVSYREFYAELQRLQLEAVDREIEVQRQLLEAAPEGDRDEILTKVADLEREKTRIRSENARQLLVAERELAREREALETRLLGLTGRTAEARARAIEESFRDLRARLAAEGDAEGVALVDRIIDVEAARARLGELERVVGQAQQRLRAREQALDAQVEAGTRSELEAREELAGAYEAVAIEIEALLPEMAALAEVTGDPDATLRVEQLRLAMQNLRNDAVLARDVFRDLKIEILQATQGALATFFSTGITGAESLSAAFRNMALQIVNSIQQIIAQLIALQIVKSLTGFLGIGLPFAAGGQVPPAGRLELGVSAASGGLIRGPGGPTDDRIPAWLSSGEYVIRAAVVKEWGPEFFDVLNRGGGRLRARAPDQILPRFAEGGLVEVGQGGRGGRGQDGAIEIGLNDEILEARVKKYLESPQGERVVLKVAKNNRRGMQRMLGQ